MGDHSELMDLPCFPHIINIIGENLAIPLASSLLRHLLSVFSFSHACSQEWRNLTDSSFPSHSKTRWYSLFDVGGYVARNYHNVIEFLATTEYGMILVHGK